MKTTNHSDMRQTCQYRLLERGSDRDGCSLMPCAYFCPDRNMGESVFSQKIILGENETQHPNIPTFTHIMTNSDSNIIYLNILILNNLLIIIYYYCRCCVFVGLLGKCWESVGFCPVLLGFGVLISFFGEVLKNVNVGKVLMKHNKNQPFFQRNPTNLTYLTRFFALMDTFTNRLKVA